MHTDDAPSGKAIDPNRLVAGGGDDDDGNGRGKYSRWAATVARTSSRQDQPRDLGKEAQQAQQH